MHLFYCELPLLHLEHTRDFASNEDIFIPSIATATGAVANSNVRLMRRPQEGDITRFALSGKLSDVCAALDQLAAQESNNAWRCAF